MTWVLDIAPVAAATASSAAAVAAWRSVAGTQRAAEAALEPVLTCIVTSNAPRDDDPRGTPELVGVEVRNVGPGVAKRPGLWVAAFGRLLRAEYMGDGYMEPGSVMDVVTPIVGPAKDGDVAAMVWCRDHRELLHVWNHRGQRRTYRPRRGQEPWEVSVRYADMWRWSFPHLPSEELEPIVSSPGRWVKRRPTGHAPLDFDGPRWDQRRASGLPLRRRARVAVRGAARAWRHAGAALPPDAPEPASQAQDRLEKGGLGDDARGGRAA